MWFDYLEPMTIEEAISLLTKHNGKAKIIAGGTDVVPQMRRKLITSGYLLDITGISELCFIKYDEKGGVRIGPLTTIRELEKSSELKQSHPVIPQAASQMASPAIRNVATVGGNLCNALPSADMVPGLIALSAKIKVIGPGGERTLPLEDFFISSGKTVLKADELLVEIQVPPLPPNTRCVYLKHSLRGSIDLALVGVAVAITIKPGEKVCQDIKIVLGNVAPTAIRARKAEEVLRGEKINEATISRCAQVASGEAHPRSGSFRASPAHKKEMVKVFTERAIRETIS